MRPITVQVGALVAADVDAVAQAQTPLAAGNLTLNGAKVVNGVGIIAAAGQQRQVLFTFAGADAGRTLTLYGTNASGNTQSESVAGASSGTSVSVLHYQTVTRVAIDAASAGAIEVGTNGVGSTRWINFDEWSMPQIAIQCNGSGTVDYTVQQTLDDPTSPTNPVTALDVTWINHPDSNLVGATGDVQGNYAYMPKWARILLNSGTGSVQGTFIQSYAVSL